MNNFNNEKFVFPQRKLAYILGLGPFCMLAILQLLTLGSEKLDYPLQIALICFAIGLPSLVVGIMVFLIKWTYPKIFEQYQLEKQWEYLTVRYFFAIGILILVIGITALFFHFQTSTKTPLGILESLDNKTKEEWLRFLQYFIDHSMEWLGSFFLLSAIFSIIRCEKLEKYVEEKNKQSDSIRKKRIVIPQSHFRRFASVRRKNRRAKTFTKERH